MMKKFFAVATMFALVVGFAACSGGDDEPTPPTQINLVLTKLSSLTV